MSVMQSLWQRFGKPGDERQFQSDATPEGIDDGVDRPNIVVIVTDDMRDSDWQALRKSRQLVADQGTVYPNFFLTTPVCSPSRSSILTGLYAHNHGVSRNDGKNGGYAQFKQRNLGERSIPNVLKSVGYRTGLFGKFMNGTPAKGGIPGAWDRWMASTELPYYRPLMNDNGKERKFTKKNQYATDIIASRAVEFIRSTPAETPLFLFFTPKPPHGPSTPARRDRGTFSSVQRERSPDVNETDVSDKPNYIRQSKGIGLSKLDNLERLRLDSLVAADDAVERIIGTLESEGRLANTVIFVLSDNGFMMGSHRYLTKGVPYRNSTRVMMAVRGPDFEEGAIDPRLSANIDILPTIAALAGAVVPDVDGISLLEDADRDEILLECFGGGPPYRAVRNARYLYVENQNGERELYDYDSDPFELDNLLPGAEALAAPLATELERLRDCTGTGCS